MKRTLGSAAIKTILAPTDLSPGPLPGVIQAAELAQRFQAKLILVTAVQSRGRPMRGTVGIWTRRRTPFGSSPRGSPDRSRVAVRQSLSVRFLGVVGTPVQVILQVANTEGVDLFVMATRGRSGLGRLFYGSVAGAVVRVSPSPVLTIRTGGAPARTVAAAYTDTDSRGGVLWSDPNGTRG